MYRLLEENIGKRTTSQWMAASFGVALAIVLVIRMSVEPDERLGVALRATARWSFFLFWLASCGGALLVLFGPRFRALAQHGRDFGLSFASAHVVHLSLVAWLYYSAVDLPRHSTLIYFSIAAIWTYVLAILSFKRLSANLNPKVWRIVRTLGIEYIAFAFLHDFVKKPFQGGAANLVIYLPLLALAIAGPSLRLAAAVKRRRHARKQPQAIMGAPQ